MRRVEWSSVIELLGKSTDAEIAKRLGVSHTAVYLKRRELGIPARKPGRRHLPLRRRGRPPIDWPSVIPLLGTMADNELARSLGVSHTSIHTKRRELGIRPHRLTDALIDDFGTDTDAAIARKHGVHWAYVSRLRRKLGIPKYKAPHGTESSYRSGCRCDACRAAHAEAFRRHRVERPEVFRAIDARRRDRKKLRQPKVQRDGDWMFDPNL